MVMKEGLLLALLGIGSGLGVALRPVHRALRTEKGRRVDKP
jgi:hypothetical protein